MDSYERVNATLKRQRPDRAPIFTYLTDKTPYISEDLRAFVVENSDVFHSRWMHIGFMCTGQRLDKTEKPLEDGWVEHTHSFGSERFTEIIKSGDTGSYIGYAKHLLSDIGDLARVLDIPYLPPTQNKPFREWIEEMNSAARELYSSGRFMRLVIYSPIFFPAAHSSPQDMAVWSIEQAEVLHSLMDVILQRELEYLDYLMPRLTFPPIFNIGGAEYGIPPLMSPRGFDDYVLRYDKPVVELIHKHGHTVFCHSHGKVRNFIPKFIEIGVDGLHPLEPVGATGDCDLREIKREFGRDLCLIGNIQYDDFERLSPDEIEKSVRDVMLAAKEGGGLILAPSATPYHTPMPEHIEENLKRFIEAGRKYGEYD